MTDAKPVIYIADDEPDLLDVLQEALETAGYEVVAFRTGDALLEHATKETPDLVLLDINMPGSSGWDIQGALQEQMASVPVIAVTAQGGPSVERSAIDTLGFTDFLRKPFKMSDLWSKVEAALGKAPA